MQLEDLERIAKLALRELGAGNPPIRIVAEPAERWRLEVGGQEPLTMTIRAGSGTTPQFIREQIFNQFGAR
jgi:hypothetical protein